jgi:hypothetical protein
MLRHPNWMQPAFHVTYTGVLSPHPKNCQRVRFLADKEFIFIRYGVIVKLLLEGAWLFFTLSNEDLLSNFVVCFLVHVKMKYGV